MYSRPTLTTRDVFGDAQSSSEDEDNDPTPRENVNNRKFESSVVEGCIIELEEAGMMESHAKDSSKLEESDTMDSHATDSDGDAGLDDDINQNLEVLGEIYYEYSCQVARLGGNHPDAVVESSSLASICAPDCKYNISIPTSIFEAGLISKVQEEALRLALQKHEEIRNDGYRAGFLIGDGAGVGKGRTIAAIMYENYLQGRKKAIWLSVSPDLCDVAQKDFNDIGADVEVFTMKALTSKKHKKGVLFCTYSTLVHKGLDGRSSRLEDIIEWFGETYDGVIAFDEAHRAKNKAVNIEKPGSLFGEKVYELQLKLPLSRVVYVSATGASEPRNMMYMSRLGLWGSGGLFESEEDFLAEMNERDVCGMELLSMHLKSKGSYIARQLSYTGVSFNVERVCLKEQFIELYNSVTVLWGKMYTYLELNDVPDLNQKKKFSMFWSCHQRFFKHLCIASKVEKAVEITRNEIKRGNCVVIGLQSTGESKFEEFRSEEKQFEELVSTTALILSEVIRKCFGVTLTPTSESSDDKSNVNRADVQAIVNEARRLSKMLPYNTLDELIHKLYGPDKVAELTARKGRLIYGSNGKFNYQSRRAQNNCESINQYERDAFMRGDKLIAIVSDAASTGISLHADSRAKNTRKRVHITIELPWSADKAIQQFGRTHRSNQNTPPTYILLVSELAGDTRFASGVAQRLEGLGALGHGDRRAGAAKDLSQFNFNNRYGEKGVNLIMDIAKGNRRPVLSAEKGYQDFFASLVSGLKTVGLPPSKRSPECTVSRFLNRLLGLPVQLQNDTFNHFAKMVSAMVVISKKMGRYDLGILDMNAKILPKVESLRTFGQESDLICIEKITTDRGMDWESAYLKQQLCRNSLEGFYVSRFAGKELVLLAVQDMQNGFAIYRPSTGKGFKIETIRDVSKRERVSPSNAKILWNQHYEQAGEMCHHEYLFNKCKLKEDGKSCECGLRWKTQYLITGQILKIWPVLRSVLNSIQVVRVPCGENKKLIGILVEEHDALKLIRYLESCEVEVIG